MDATSSQSSCHAASHRNISSDCLLLQISLDLVVLSGLLWNIPGHIGITLQLPHHARIQRNSEYLRSIQDTGISLLDTCRFPRTLRRRGLRDPLFSDHANSSGLSSGPTHLGLGLGPDGKAH